MGWAAPASSQSWRWGGGGERWPWRVCSGALSHILSSLNLLASWHLANAELDVTGGGEVVQAWSAGDKQEDTAEGPG